MKETKNIFLISKTLNKKKSFGLKDLYWFYIINLDKRERLYKINKIDYNTWKGIINAYMEEIFRKMIYETYIVKLDLHMGDLFIAREKLISEINPKTGKLEIINSRIDWKQTIELWNQDAEAKRDKKKVFFMNEHTDGYRLFYVWNIFHCKAKNKNAYRLIICKKQRRKLYETALKGLLSNDYPVKDNYRFKYKYKKNRLYAEVKKRLSLQEI